MDLHTRRSPLWTSKLDRRLMRRIEQLFMVTFGAIRCRATVRVCELETLDQNGSSTFELMAPLGFQLEVTQI